MATDYNDRFTKGLDKAVRDFTLDKAKEYILVQGEVVYAANLLQDRFFQLFRLALSLERVGGPEAELTFHDHAIAIWHVIQADISQREMAVSAISTVPTKLAIGPAVNRLKWARKKANKLAEYRNLVAHSPVYLKGEVKGKWYEFRPRFAADGMRPIHKSRLQMISGVGFWRTLRNDLLSLSDYVDAVNVQVRRLDAERRGMKLFGAPKSWPSKPRLRSAPRLEEIERQLSRAAQPPKRRTRRRSSPAKPRREN